MEFLTVYWLPILLSTVAVFLAGSVLNMVFTHHTKDYSPLPDEDAFRDLINEQGLKRKFYSIPFVQSSEAWKDPAIKEKMATGPVALLAVGRPGTNWNPQLVSQAIYALLVSVMVSYVATAALGTGDQEYLKVFQITGTVAFLSYSAAMAPNSIWFNVPWPNTLRHMFDGLIYGLLTAGIFGWLW